MPDPNYTSLVSSKALRSTGRMKSGSIISGSGVNFLKKSASILLIKDCIGGLKVLMIRRSNDLIFAPGALVFPGGCLDISDTKKYLWSQSITAAPRMDMMFRIAALRELWEETGILLTDRPAAPVLGGERYARSLALGPFLKSKKARLLTNSLMPFSRWITPQGLPKRYDTHFFIAPFVGECFPRPDGSEAVWTGWLTPSDIWQDCQRRGVPLMAPTLFNLIKLSRSKTVDHALKDARQLPNITFLPKMIQNKRILKIPLGSGYDKLYDCFRVRVDRKAGTQTILF